MKEVRNPAPLPEADGQGQHPEGGGRGMRGVILRIHTLSPNTVYDKRSVFPIATPTMGRADLAIHSRVVGDRHETVVEGLYTRNGEAVKLTAQGERLTMTVGERSVRGAEVDTALDIIANGLATEGHRIGTSHTPPDAPSAQADRLHALSIYLPYANESAETTWATVDGVSHIVRSRWWRDGRASDQVSYMTRTPQRKPVPGVSERPILVNKVEEVLYSQFFPDGWYIAREEVPDEITAALPDYQQEAARRYNTEQSTRATDTSHPDRDEKVEAALRAVTDHAAVLELAASDPGRDQIEDGDTLFTGTSDAGSGGYVFPERGDDNDQDRPLRYRDERNGFTEI